jgi:membrane protein implicated in regulation of membrane protease activity
MTIAHYWLAFGVGFLLLEAFGISGIGLLFAGCGALTTGTLLQAGMIPEEATMMQALVFAVSTGLWAALLWKPMQKFTLRKNAPGYSNMVGETAYVGGNGLKKGLPGEATWSGTIMNAELHESISATEIPAGAQVTIVDVVGNTLIVKPK